jgi:hypothetical protein
MSAWLLLAVFASLYVILVAFAVGIFLGERREARRRDAGRGSAVVHVSDRFTDDLGQGDWPDTVAFDKAAEDAIRVTREWRRP